MRYLCLLLVILVVYWYCKNDTIEGNWVFKEGEFKKVSDYIKGFTVKEGSMLENILNDKVIHTDMKNKNLESEVFESTKENKAWIY